MQQIRAIFTFYMWWCEMNHLILRTTNKASKNLCYQFLSLLCSEENILMAKISQSMVYALSLCVLFFVQHKPISITSLFVNFTWKVISLSATWFDGRIYMNREAMLNALYLELQQGCDHPKAACDCIDHTVNYKLPATPLPWQKSVWPFCSNTVSHTHATLYPPYTVLWPWLQL